MERIPKRLLDKRGDIIADMPIAASFITNEKGSHTITLQSAEHITKPNGADERVPGTGLTLRILGGKRMIDNSEIFKELMTSRVFQDGRVRLDPEDPTGFWREAGVLKGSVETREVITSPGAVRNPEFEALPDVKKMKKPEKQYVPIVVS